MPTRRHFLSLAAGTCIAAGLSGCGIYGIGNPGEEDVIGRWRETTPGVTDGQGYIFDAAGKISCFGMPKTCATKYKCRRGLMEIEGYVLTDDGRKLQFKKTYAVEKPDNETLLLRAGYECRTFVRE